MNREIFDGNNERTVLIGMLTNPIVLAKIASKWEGGSFPSSICNTLGSLAVEYYRKHHNAPRKHITSLFAEWAEGKGETATSEGEQMLGTLPNETYKLNGEVNPDYIVDLAAKVFNENRVDKLIESLQIDRQAGQADKAISKINSFRKLELGAKAGKHFFQDDEAIMSPLRQEQESRNLIELHGSIGELFYGHLRRGSFAAFAGPQKSGKSYWLTWLAYTAMLQRRRVAYFQVGDMSEDEVGERFDMLMSQHPTSSNKDSKFGWPCSVKIPIKIELPKKDDEKKLPTIQYKEKRFDSPLTPENAIAARNRMVENVLKSKRSYFYMSCHSNYSINILGIRAIVEDLAKDGWPPDICIIDYADNLAPVDKRKDNRDQINETWGLMSSLRLDLHLLLITATQVKATGFDAYWLDRKHFSEDNRKLNHPSSFHGINVTNEERQIGVCRLNTFSRRRGKPNAHTGPYIAQCLDVANACVLSAW